MYKKTSLALIVFLSFVMVVGSTFTVFAHMDIDQTGRLQVTGNAVVNATPDTAQISLGVETNDASAELAAQENAERMAKIMVALKEIGLSDREIRTSGYNIYSYNQVLNRGTEQETTITTYSVQNKIEITTKNLDMVGQIVDGAVQAGANQVQGIRFDVADKQELQLQALQNAIKQARNKGETMAEAAGITIGGLLNMTEDLGSYAPVYDAPVVRAQMANMVETSIVPGDVEISAKVTMIFWF